MEVRLFIVIPKRPITRSNFHAFNQKLTIQDYEIDLLVQHIKSFPYSAVISPCVRPPQPLYGHVEGSISSVDFHAVSPSPRDARPRPLSLNEIVFSGAVSSAEVHVVVLRAVVCGPDTRAVDGDLSSNVATHLQHR